MRITIEHDGNFEEIEKIMKAFLAMGLDVEPMDPDDPLLEFDEKDIEKYLSERESADS